MQPADYCHRRGASAGNIDCERRAVTGCKLHPFLGGTQLTSISTVEARCFEIVVVIPIARYSLTVEREGTLCIVYEYAYLVFVLLLLIGVGVRLFRLSSATYAFRTVPSQTFRLEAVERRGCERGRRGLRGPITTSLDLILSRAFIG